ncbi:MAG: ribosome-associated translation inhibitor RaiA [Chloroflexi bacterium]|nr:ribosome-associated translation inhibitor RaiA [Chloroflexota bacterium]
MESEIRGKNLTISESSRSYIARKLDRLSRRLDNIGEARVELTMENTRSQQDRVVAQITLNCNGTILRGQERAPTINAAIDAVAEILEGRIRRLRSKLYKSEQARRTDKAPSMREPESPAISQEEEDSLETETQGVVRVKRFSMKPMPVEEAIDQMELLGHDFFLFYNIATNEYSVLYRRFNGGYGLLEPELM